MGRHDTCVPGGACTLYKCVEARTEAINDSEKPCFTARYSFVTTKKNPNLIVVHFCCCNEVLRKRRKREMSAKAGKVCSGFAHLPVGAPFA